MPQEFKVPELGENIDSGTVTKVLIAEGGRVSRDQGVVELETGKAVLEVPSTVEGLVEQILVKAGDEVKVGQPLFRIREENPAAPAAPPPVTPEPRPVKLAAQAEAAAPETTPEPPPPAAPAAPPAPGDPLPVSPAVRRIAREQGVELAAVTGTGANGRILESDVRAQAHLRTRAEEPKKEQALGSLPDFSRWGPVQREPMSAVRRLTAQRMAQSWAQIPHAVQFGRADISALDALRARHRAEIEKAGGRLSLTVFLLKALAGALKAFPLFNASVDMERREIVRKSSIHLAVAMDTGRGLVAPVIRDADRRNLTELAVELARLTDRARDGKLAPESLQGSTFTLTNAGAIGGGLFIPLINWPEAAILGAGRAEPGPRPLMPLTLSYDHRLNDGADAVRFMNRLVELLEEPERLLVKG